MEGRKEWRNRARAVTARALLSADLVGRVVLPTLVDVGGKLVRRQSRSQPSQLTDPAVEADAIRSDVAQSGAGALTGRVGSEQEACAGESSLLC